MPRWPCSSRPAKGDAVQVDWRKVVRVNKRTVTFEDLHHQAHVTVPYHQTKGLSRPTRTRLGCVPEMSIGATGRRAVLRCAGDDELAGLSLHQERGPKPESAERNEGPGVARPTLASCPRCKPARGR